MCAFFVCVCVFVYVCDVCVHGSMPVGAIWLLDRALLINREVNCCGSTQTVSNITLGTWRQQTIYMFVYAHTPVCVFKHKMQEWKTLKLFP